jgi:Ser/Thr protein kinase RdoA (MazF antagonist)
MISSVLSVYGFNPDQTNVIPFGSGLINRTWKIIFENKTYILQRVNDAVFKNPQDIADNIKMVSDYLRKNHPGYKFVAPITSVAGNEMVFIEDGGYFRLFNFVKGSHTVDAAETAQQAYEAAEQFGGFTFLLSGMDPGKFHITIPFFHDLSLRCKRFTEALKNGNEERIDQSEELIKTILSHSEIVSVYEKIKTDPEFRLRIMHHDTKISNVLFDENDKGLCVIDLDTIMPGYFISDVGDMMRTYLSPANEEEKDFSKIYIRDEFYTAIVQGYCAAMKNELTPTEKKYFFYAGKFMIYMQAVRFLTDYLYNDVYYGSKYEGHNFVRAKNQAVLLQRFIEKETEFKNAAK